jgi:outer membrane lipoprotein-sorting protein
MQKKQSLLFSISFVTVAFLCVLLGARAQNPPPPPAGKTAGQQFKNIQVLKDIPADDLIPAMQFISASLGVECEYCHVEHAMDKDDKKEKKFARHMMEMQMNINKDNFEGKRWVTCYSCHRGAAKPISVPVISAVEKMPDMMAGESVDKSSYPKADALLEKYLAAVGGADALKKVTSRVQKGSVTFSGQKNPIEIYANAPDKRLSSIHRKEGDSLTAYDGKTGWMTGFGRVRIMTAQESAGFALDADMNLASHLKTMFSKTDVDEGEKIDGHDTWLVIGEREGKPPLRLFFDKQSGLLLRELRYSDSPLGFNPLQIDFADYRDSGGVKIPFRWIQSRPGNHFTVQIESSEVNVPIDDSKFAQPPQPAMPPQPAPQ